MPIINFREREINCKIVYYGPGFGGKTTNIEMIHENVPEHKRTNLQAIETEGDRTLFFEQFAVELGDCGGMRVRFMVFGVPGQPFYKATRRMVLRGCDGIVFVADSDADRMQDNQESMEDLKDLLEEHGLDFASIPLVIQYNKQDLEHKLEVSEMDRVLNHRQVPSFEGAAVQNIGVQDTFKAICKEVVDKLQTSLNLNRS